MSPSELLEDRIEVRGGQETPAPECIEVIAEELRAFCRRCHRLLRGARSVELGIGPTCRRKELLHTAEHAITGAP